MGQSFSEAPIAAGDAPISASANTLLISTDSKEFWLMVVAGRGTVATLASPAQISHPANSPAHHPCCRMGWLDNAACGFGCYIDRGINDAAPG